MNIPPFKPLSENKTRSKIGVNISRVPDFPSGRGDKFIFDNNQYQLFQGHYYGEDLEAKPRYVANVIVFNLFNF